MEVFIHYIIKYNEKIIYILGAVICLFSAIVVWWQVFRKKESHGETSVDINLSGIEESLKKILSQTHTAIGSISSSGAAVVSKADAATGGVILDGIIGSDGKPITDAVGVKKELEMRAKIIDDLRTEVVAVKAQDPSSEFLSKIKALEGRLAEYEIIEDDIADLSILKEENARLKKEIEGIKRASPQMVDQFAEAMAEANSASSKTEGGGEVTPALGAAETKVEVENVSMENVKVGTPLSPSEDPMLAAAVAAAQAELGSEEKSSIVDTNAGDVVSAVAPATAAPAPTSPPPIAASAVSSAPPPGEVAKGDIFGEFSQTEESHDDPLAVLGQIDPDKMLEELKDLNLDMAVGAEALEESPDIDKMEQEATTLDLKKG